VLYIIIFGTLSCHVGVASSVAPAANAESTSWIIIPPERSIVMSLSVCVFVAYLRKYVCDLYRIFAHVPYGCGSVLLWRRCDTICTSAFTDDVILAHKPRQFNVAAQLMEAQPTCSLGLGYKRRVAMPVAGQWTHGPTFLAPRPGLARPQWAC